MAQHVEAVFETEESSSAAVAMMRSHGILPVSAKVLPDGRWIVVTEAPFGRAAGIIEMLRAGGALEVRQGVTSSNSAQDNSGLVSEPVKSRRGNGPARVISSDDHDDSFSVSSLIGLPILIDNPAPLSSLLGIPALIRN